MTTHNTTKVETVLRPTVIARAVAFTYRRAMPSLVIYAQYMNGKRVAYSMQRRYDV